MSTTKPDDPLEENKTVNTSIIMVLIAAIIFFLIHIFGDN